MASPVPPAVSESSAHADGGPISAGGTGASFPRSPEGSAARPLANRNVGILCSDPERPEALLLQHVVSELGARAALVRPNLDASASSSVEHTARVLGLLYDAVICVGLPAHSVDRLREFARMPVLADLVLPVVVAPDPGTEDVLQLGRQILSRLAGAPV